MVVIRRQLKSPPPAMTLRPPTTVSSHNHIEVSSDDELKYFYVVWLTMPAIAGLGPVVAHVQIVYRKEHPQGTQKTLSGPAGYYIDLACSPPITYKKICGRGPYNHALFR